MLAFSLQVQLVQTHIHPVSLFTGVVSQVDAAPYATKAPVKKVPPSNNDPANCPICQAVLHGGQFISPSAVALALPSEVIVLIPLAIAARARIEAASHNWQGRAPPRA